MDSRPTAVQFGRLVILVERSPNHPTAVGTARARR